MPVPEASVNKNSGLVFRKHEIGLSRQFRLQSKTQPRRMQESAYTQFRPCVSAPDASHHPASGSLVNDIGHQASKSGNPAAFMKIG
jgi:hypothetical protein